MLVESSAVWGAVGVLVGSGGLFGAVKGWRALGYTRDESEIGRLREDVKGLESKLAECEERHGLLETRIAGLEQSQDSHLGRWIKDAHKRIIWVNPKAMISIFAPLGYTRDDVEGKRFDQLDRFDATAIEEIERLDEAALAQDGSAYSAVVRLHPLLPPMTVIKLAASGKAGELIYEGYAYRSNSADIERGLQAGRQVAAIEASAEHVIDGRQAARHRRPGADKPEDS